MLKEFREFALRGNLVDLAIGFIIGAAFSGLVQSVVNDLIMPIVGVITGGVDFSQLYVQLSGDPQPTLAQAREAGATLAYCNFITLLIAPAAPPREQVLLEEIRDLLAKKA